MLLCLSSHAQPNPLNRRAMAITGLATSNPFAPITTNLGYWWVSGDLPQGVTVSNQFPDRIQAMLSQKDANFSSPTNSATGLYFDSTKPTLLTNNVAPVSNPQTYQWWFVFKPTGTITDTQILFTQNPSTTSNIELRSGGLSAGTLAHLTTSALASGHIYDGLIMSSNNVATVILIYTNGVLGATSTTDSDVHAFKVWGADSGGSIPYHGYLLEVMYFTNSWLSDPAIAQLHKYATNKYGYAP